MGVNGVERQRVEVQMTTLISAKQTPSVALGLQSPAFRGDAQTLGEGAEYSCNSKEPTKVDGSHSFEVSTRRGARRS